MADAFPLLLVALVWSIYGLLHSLTASLAAKRWMAARRPHWMPGYRLGFNLLALILLIPPLWLTNALRGEALWRWDGPLVMVSWILTALALLAFWYSLRQYDGGEFLGLRQWREGLCEVEDQERLHISPLHRHVRHPWYCIALVLIWTRDLDAPSLVAACVISGYFVFGSRLEERKLLGYHGEAYRRYRERVPGLLPVPGRSLSASEASELEALAAES